MTVWILAECLATVQPDDPPRLPLGRKGVAALWKAHGAQLEPMLDARDSTSLHCWCVL